MKHSSFHQAVMSNSYQIGVCKLLSTDRFVTCSPGVLLPVGLSGLQPYSPNVP